MSEDQEQQGSFVSGLFIGVLLGAVAYFVTHTKEGKELKNNFIDHWEDLKNNLINEGVLPEKEKGISDYISAVRGKILEFLDEPEDQNQKKSKKKSGSKKKGSRKKRLFKGI